MKSADFKEFYLEELLAFFGLNIAIGLLKLPQLKDIGPQTIYLHHGFQQ